MKICKIPKAIITHKIQQPQSKEEAFFFVNKDENIVYGKELTFKYNCP